MATAQVSVDVQARINPKHIVALHAAGDAMTRAGAAFIEAANALQECGDFGSEDTEEDEE